MSTIHARPGRACINKIRIEYHLPSPLLESLLPHFTGATCDIQRFSQLARGAHDHVTLTWGSGVHVTGALGSQRLVASFSKLPGNGSLTLIRIFEALLEATFGATIEPTRL